MNTVEVLDKGFETAAEPVMEHKLSVNVTLVGLLSLPTLHLSVKEFPFWWLILSLSTYHNFHFESSVLFEPHNSLSEVQP